MREVVSLDAEPQPWRGGVRVPGANTYVAVESGGGLLADRDPGLVSALEAQPQLPLAQKHVGAALVVRVIVQVGQPGDAHAGIDEEPQYSGIASVCEGGTLASLQQRGQLRIIEELLGLLGDLR